MNKARTALALCSLILVTPHLYATSFGQCSEERNATGLAHSQCTTVNAPLNYTSNNGDKQIELFVRRFPAKKLRRGSLWMIAGGPGESGASFYSLIDTFHQAFPHLDLIVPDHRGTGYSTAICPQESVDSKAGKQLVGQEWGACFSHMYANLDHVQSFTITNAAKDLALLINQLGGEGKQYVYGVSYGTQLTLRLMQLPGIEIDGVVLDSLVPLQDNQQFDLSRRSNVVNAVGISALEYLASTNNALDAERLQARLKTILDNKPLLSDHHNTLPSSKLSDALGLLLDIPHLRGQIPTIINGLHDGDHEPLATAVTDMQNYYSTFNKGYSNFGSSIPLVQVISSSENNPRLTLSEEALKQEEAKLLFTSPLPGLLRGNSMPVYDKDQYFAKVPTALPPTLVLHGTLDPKTHVDGAREHVSALSPAGSVSLVEVDHAPHFIALHAPQCFTQVSQLFFRGEPIVDSECAVDIDSMGKPQTQSSASAGN